MFSCFFFLSKSKRRGTPGLYSWSHLVFNIYKWYC